jgi:hypothetical protein
MEELEKPIRRIALDVSSMHEELQGWYLITICCVRILGLV